MADRTLKVVDVATTENEIKVSDFFNFKSLYDSIQCYFNRFIN